MITENQQAQLLDIYFDMLLHNPTAQPPTGLDAEVAQIARRLANVEQNTPSLTKSKRECIWYVSAFSQITTFLNQHQEGRETTMLRTKPVSNNGQILVPSQRLSWMAVVAVISLFLFGGLLLFSGGFGNDDNPQYLQANMALTATSTVDPAITPDGSPTPTHDPGPVEITPTFTPEVTATTEGSPEPTKEVTETVTPEVTEEPTIEPEATTESGEPEGDEVIFTGFALPAYQDEPETVGLNLTYDHTLTNDEPFYVFAYNGHAGDILRADIVADAPVKLSYFAVENPQVNETDSMRFIARGVDGETDSSPSLGFHGSTVISLDQDATIWFGVEKYPDTDSVAFTFTLTEEKIETLTYNSTTSFDYPFDGMQKLYEFEGIQGDIVSISTAGAVDTVIFLEDPQGQSIMADDDSGEGLNAELYQLQLPETGVYHVRVQISELNTVLSEETVELSLMQHPVLKLASDEPLLVSVSAKQSMQVVSFVGAEGETLELSSIVPATSSLVQIQVVQDGEELAMIETSGTNDEAPVSRVFTIPNNGEVLIFINFQPAQSATVDEMGIAHGEVINLSLELTRS